MDQEDWIERAEREVAEKKKQALTDSASADQTGPFLTVRADQEDGYAYWEFQIPMQHRMNPVNSRNGCLDTEILGALIERLEQFVGGPMACSESKEAISLLQQAKARLEGRVARRKAEGTYATMKEVQGQPNTTA